MNQPQPKIGTLHLFCGKIASGKSTLAATLARAPNAILASEDHWLSTLFPDEILTLEDYRRCAARLEHAMAPHIVNLLTAGLDVILDFHANTKHRRAWARRILESSEADHVLHLLDVPDEVCKARLRARNEAGTHAYNASDEIFEQFTAHYDPPSDDEGWNVVRHDQL